MTSWGPQAGSEASEIPVYADLLSDEALTILCNYLLMYLSLLPADKFLEGRHDVSFILETV